MIRRKIPLYCLGVLLISLFLPFALHAQSRVSGTVMNASTGEPVAGVSVLISDLHTGTQTSDSGRFVFSSGAKGVHLLEFSHIQYSSQTQQANFSVGENMVIFLQPSIVENAAVVVTGVAKATDSRKIPFQVSVIKAEDMRRQAALTVVDYLLKVPGITSLQTGPAVQKPVIRGLSYNRVLVIHDGVRQEGQQWGDEHGLEVAGEGIEKIEVLKGPASLVYGSDAMAGVVNIISDADIVKNTMKGNVSTALHSNNRMRNISGRIALNKNGLVLQGDGSAKAAADFRNARDGDVFNSKFRQQSAALMVGLHRRWGFSHLRYSHFNLLTGMVEGERDSLGNFLIGTVRGEEPASQEDFLSTKPVVPYQQVTHRKISVDNNFLFNKKRLYANVGVQENRRREYGDIHFSDPSLDFRLRTLTWVARLHLLDKKKWELTIGSNGMHQKNSNLAVEALIPEYSLVETGWFAYMRRSVGKSALSGGLRFDSRRISVDEFEGGSGILNSSFSRQFSSVSASAGLSTPVMKNLIFKANISRAFRAPAISELSSDGAHEGTARYEYGSRNLRNETSWQSDIGFEYASPHLALTVSGFYNYFENYIFYQKLSSSSGMDSLIIDGDEELTAFTFNQRKAFLAGFEISADLHPHPLDWLHIESNFALVKGQFFEPLDGSSNIPMMPAPKLATEVRAEAKKFRGLENLYLKFEADHNFKQNKAFTGFGTETNTNAYTLFNLGLGSEILKGNNRVLSFHFAIRNLFNTVYQNHLSRLKYAPVNLNNGFPGVWAMGRNVTLSVQIPFSGKL